MPPMRPTPTVVRTIPFAVYMFANFSSKSDVVWNDTTIFGCPFYPRIDVFPDPFAVFIFTRQEIGIGRKGCRSEVDNSIPDTLPFTDTLPHTGAHCLIFPHRFMTRAARYIVERHIVAVPGPIWVSSESPKRWSFASVHGALDDFVLTVIIWGIRVFVHKEPRKPFCPFNVLSI